jgi:hypothetical protein
VLIAVDAPLKLKVVPSAKSVPSTVTVTPPVVGPTAGSKLVIEGPE